MVWNRFIYQFWIHKKWRNAIICILHQTLTISAHPDSSSSGTQTYYPQWYHQYCLELSGYKPQEVAGYWSSICPLSSFPAKNYHTVSMTTTTPSARRSLHTVQWRSVLARKQLLGFPREKILLQKSRFTLAVLFVKLLTMNGTSHWTLHSTDCGLILHIWTHQNCNKSMINTIATCGKISNSFAQNTAQDTANKTLRLLLKAC